MEIVDAQPLWDPRPGYLNTSSYGLPPRPAFSALEVALDDWRHGRTSWEGWDESTKASRTSFATMLGVPATDVAVASTVSGLLGPVGAALPDGARVLVPDIEFTSNVFPWAVHADRGVEVVAVSPDKLAGAIDERTTLVAFSAVQSSTGEVAAYDEIVAAARAVGAMVVVDATQAIGWLHRDWAAADVVVVGAYKWLMAPRGVAYAYLSPAVRDGFRPLQAGWYAGDDPHTSYYGLPLRLAEDARRFDVSPAWFCFVGQAPALQILLDVGVDRVNAHNVGLANRFRAGLGLAPSDSAIVSTDVADAEAKLKAAGIRAAVRGGKVRVSFHLYSTTADVDSALAALTR
ncbi:aminotransferase class V-fold PLP-dependent enzyme [Tenggerimyces flavus]|uniref:Aminotransferase class V-fold PLP-dependent enzyme n=1 Tax=Tenggerimyces flavus TaxID=1708749 RepID=A0ABV7YLV5_9ACTN|nr:aminotransferase class V-fold PLP-dependent enzyme [Tenggerimyces flavus]MBM7787471.1 selenocysteine lyase/cysteine desulfurase [Tenggerimyces flavus]